MAQLAEFIQINQGMEYTAANSGKLLRDGEFIMLKVPEGFWNAEFTIVTKERSQNLLGQWDEWNVRQSALSLSPLSMAFQVKLDEPSRVDRNKYIYLVKATKLAPGAGVAPGGAVDPNESGEGVVDDQVATGDVDPGTGNGDAEDDEFAIDPTTVGVMIAVVVALVVAALLLTPQGATFLARFRGGGPAT